MQFLILFNLIWNNKKNEKVENFKRFNHKIYERKKIKYCDSISVFEGTFVGFKLLIKNHILSPYHEICVFVIQGIEGIIS